MLKVHNKIIKEIVEENKKDSKVVSILLYGSLARGVANKNSDVDIEIVYEGVNIKTLVKKDTESKLIWNIGQRKNY